MEIRLTTDVFHVAKRNATRCNLKARSALKKHGKKNKPKQYPNSNEMIGRFLRTRFAWLRHVNNSYNFDPWNRLGVQARSSPVRYGLGTALPFFVKTSM